LRLTFLACLLYPFPSTDRPFPEEAAMTGKLQRRRRARDHRRIIHLLNQRYHQEFIRAECLQADAALVQALRATWLFRALRWLKEKLRPSTRRTMLDGEVAPLILKPVEVSGRVSIVIPFRDRGELLRDCLASLRLGTYRDFEVILVDNGSSEPDLLRLLRRLEKKRRYRVVRDPGLFNFSRLCNAGARAAPGEWLLFLNNDTCVLTPDWLEQMITVARQPEVGIVGAKLLYPDGTVQHAGMFQRGDGVWDHFGRGRPSSDCQEVRSVPAVSAACLLISRSLFEQLNGFDEERPITHNDVDLCRRARARGHLIAITVQAQLLHYESLSRGYALTPVDEGEPPGLSWQG
jgi:GT2 family glycosyltransferase